MKARTTIPSITHAELRMLQSVAATIVAEACCAGVSRCRFGRFELTARCFDNDVSKDKVAIALIVSCAGEVIEHDMGLVAINHEAQHSSMRN